MAKKKSSVTKKRIFLLGLSCFVINFVILYSLFDVWKEIHDKKIEKEELSIKLVDLKEEEQELKVEVNKLKDPAYVAKYARERFYYSGKNEYIIKME